MPKPMKMIVVGAGHSRCIARAPIGDQHETLLPLIRL
jgi:hypothetical protein